MTISNQQKEIIENNPVFVGTSDLKNNPNITIVDGARVNDKSEIVVMNVQMKTCKDNLLLNSKCCLSVYNAESEIGCKVLGKARYKESGKDFDKSIAQQRNSRFKPQGVFLITPESIIDIK